jgi:hypothetical protein
MRDNLLKEKHSGGLDGHFVHDKTFAQLRNSYYWSSMREEVKNFMKQMHNLSVCKRKTTRTLVCISHYQFQRGCGMQSVWILFWDCLELKKGVIPYFCGRKILKNGTFHTMSEDKRCHTHHQFIFQRSSKTTWIAKEHSFRQRHQICRTLLEDSMEEAGDELVL